MINQLNLLFPGMKKILRDIEILEDWERFPKKEQFFWKDLKSYRKIFDTLYSRRSYHFLLKDLSIIRFLPQENNINYEYLDCPYIIKENEDGTEEKVEKVPTPIRYDFDPLNFNPISHPIAHIHLGIQNPIRIGTNLIFTPLTFLLFCLRQMFPEYWKKVFENEKFNIFEKHIRKKIQSIAKEFKVSFIREHYFY